VTGLVANGNLDDARSKTPRRCEHRNWVR